MKVIFLGVGEAFDEEQPNTSILLINKTKLLLDCGFRVPYQLWKHNKNQSFLDGVYISHLHADHYFGLPALLIRMVEEKRKKPFTIISQKGSKKIIERVIDYAYKGCLSNLTYKLNFIEVKDNDRIKFNELELSFSKGQHFVKDLGIRIADNKKVICYSGDTSVSKNIEELCKDSDLLIHEAYLYDKPYIYDKKFHTSIVDLIKMTERTNVKLLALVHINRDIRKKLKVKRKNIIIPNVFDKIDL
jgi:ribonuclease BN (tRNA processing enzyme)